MKKSLILGFGLLLSLPSAFAIEVHGHRGVRARRPENTLPAFEYALRLGVDYLEMDMAVTKDGIIVISHDPHISDKICLAPGGKPISEPPLIHTLTLTQVKGYDCGTLKNSRFPTQVPVPGTRIPTLAEVFQMVIHSKAPAAKKVRFNIETKSFADHPEYSVDPNTFVKLFLETVKKFKMQNRVVLQSFDYRTLDAIREMAPKVPRVALVEEANRDMVQIAKDHVVYAVSPDYELLTPKITADLHAIGVQVIPWTANDESAWKKLVDMKVDGIISDDPESLLQFLHR